MALLRESLYTSWRGPGEGRSFVAMGNVALYFTPRQPALVPDLLVSLDVQLPEDPFPKQHRSYFLWEYGKPPEVVIEIVSNRKGGELGDKLLDYARVGVAFYIVYDPERHLSQQPLRIFARLATSFVETDERQLSGVGLGVTLWPGLYDGMQETWLRWCDDAGQLLLTGPEATDAARQRAEAERQRAEAERQRADAEHQRAEAERQRADAERQRAERLADQLRSLGIDPDA